MKKNIDINTNSVRNVCLMQGWEGGGGGGGGGGEFTILTESCSMLT
jgi:hypothetical protein